MHLIELFAETGDRRPDFGIAAQRAEQPNVGGPGRIQSRRRRGARQSTLVYLDLAFSPPPFCDGNMWLYERTERRLSFQVVGDFWCECGEVLESWNGSRVPVYSLAQHENVTEAAA